MNNKLRRLLPISAVPIALGASLVTSGLVRAANLGPVAPGGAAANSFSFGGTFEIEVLDINGSGVPDDGDITELRFLNDEGEYSINTAKGAFAEFTSVSVTNLSQLGIPVIQLPFIVPSGPTLFPIPGLLALDDSSVTLPLPSAGDDNFYDLETLFLVEFSEPGGAVEFTLNTLGTYTGPDTGPLAGTWSIDSIFDGFETAPELVNAIFNNGGISNSYSASGSIVDVPEPSTLGFLLLTTVGIMAGRKKREQ